MKLQNCKKFIVRLAVLLNAIVIMLASVLVVSAESNDTYFYSFATGEAVATVSPSVYNFVGNIDLKKEMSVGTAEDFCTDKNGNWYIADSQNNQIVILNSDFKHIRTLKEFGECGTLNGPMGVSVRDDGTLGIADTGNGRLIIFSITGEDAVSLDLSDNLELESKFLPTKMGFGKDGQIYAISKNDYNGIIEMDESGNFLGYLGATNVTFSLKDYIWKKLMSETQKDKQIQFIPVEYVNLSVDSEGFVYAVSSSDTEATPVRRLNPAGNDVLSRNGYTSDVDGDITVQSAIIDVSHDGNGIYHILDNRYGRVFTYDSDGYLLYVFGGLGTTDGYTVQPVAMESDRENIFLLDKGAGRICKYKITGYASEIVKGISQYSSGDYEGSLETWKGVLRSNSNYEIAYAQIGKSLLRMGNYKDAMHYFELGNFRGDKIVMQSGYNKAFSLYRDDILTDYWWIMLLIVAALIALISLFKRFLRKSNAKIVVKLRESRFANQCRLARFILFHPFKGFWDMKREKEGSLVFSLCLTVLWILTQILDVQVTGFLFSESVVAVPDVLAIVRNCLIIFVLITVGNWCVTTLMNGEGSYKDIVMTFGYASLPLSLVGIPMSIISNFLTYSELGYIQIIDFIAVFWFVFLLFFGIQTIHQYTLKKNIATALLTVFAAVVLIFVAMVFMNLLIRMAAFGSAVYKELMLR